MKLQHSFIIPFPSTGHISAHYFSFILVFLGDVQQKVFSSLFLAPLLLIVLNTYLKRRVWDYQKPLTKLAETTISGNIINQNRVLAKAKKGQYPREILCQNGTATRKKDFSWLLSQQITERQFRLSKTKYGGTRHSSATVSLNLLLYGEK